MNNGFFITLEGGEGTGKSTLLKGLENALSELGHSVVTTREPGGTEGAETIRELLVTGDANRWNAMSEICLFYAAREDHIKRLIIPSLEAGKIIISDRFFDSTRAYQGELGEKETRVITCLEENIVGDCMPNITIVLDIDVQTGLQRAASRHGNELRFEAKTLDFHNRLRQKFLEIAKTEPQRCIVIDAAQNPEAVLEQALVLVLGRLQSGPEH